ncbi:MAG: 50S ribosomal protein L29 [Bacteroidales bacterium]
MKQNVIREMSTSELRERLDEEKKQLRKLKMNHAVSPLENPIKIQVYRKTVARILTEIHKRENEKQS